MIRVMPEMKRRLRRSHDLDFEMQRGVLAGPDGPIPSPFDLLAATVRLGRAGRLVEHLVGVSEQAQRSVGWEGSGV